MLVLAGGPEGENPVRAFSDTGLLQGDSRFPAGPGYAPAPARKRGAMLFRGLQPPLQRWEESCESHAPQRQQLVPWFGEAPGAECQVCDRQGQCQGPLSPYTAAGKGGHREGRLYSWGDVQKQLERQNPV